MTVTRWVSVACPRVNHGLARFTGCGYGTTQPEHLPLVCARCGGGLRITGWWTVTTLRATAAGNLTG